MIPTHGRLVSLALSALFAPLAFAQAPLGVGNLVVVRFSSTASSNACATFLEEYSPTGTLVQTIALPTAAAGLNYACTNSGSSTSEGQLNMSANGFYLTLGGYDAAVGTPTLPTTSAAVNRRVIARIDLNGTVDTSTGLTDTYDAGNIRAATTDDGLRFWTSGSLANGPSSGLRYVANVGDSTSTQVTLGGANTRQISVYHGNLYYTSASASGGVYGIGQLGTGLPTTPDASLPLTGFPTTVSGPSPYDMFWASPTTVYVADDQTGGAGGIQKWVNSGGTWTKLYTLALNPSTGCTGVTGFVQNGVTTLWATGRGTSSTLLTVVDNGAGSTVTSIATASGGAFRGIRRVGLPSTTQRYAVGCGAANVKVTGNGEIGTDMFTSVTNSALGIPLLGYGLQPLFAPFCGCTIAHEYLVSFIATDHTLNISPAWGATVGLVIYVQAADLFAAGGCADPFLTLTDAASFQIQ